MSAGVLGFIAISIMAAIAGGIAAARVAKQRRRVRAVPAFTLATAPAGDRVRITGVVRAGDALVAGPYSGAQAVAAVGERWELTSTGRRFRRLDRQVRAETFFLDDGTGSARVVATHVDCVIRLVPAKVATSGPGRVFGAGVLAANLSAMQNQETVEGLVKAGDRVSVVGILGRNGSELELAGSSAAPVIVSDE